MTIRDNIVEIGAYALGLCLSYYVNSVSSQNGYEILRKTKLFMLSRGKLYPERLATLAKINSALVKNHYTSAWAFLDKNKYQDAKREANKVLDINPAHVDALQMLAICEWKLGKKSDAQKYSEDVWKISPGSPPARINKAFFAIQQKHYVVALKQYKLLREKGIGNVIALMTVGFLQEEYLLNPAEHALLFASAFLNLNWGDPDEGIDDMKTFLRLTEGINCYREMRDSASGFVQKWEHVN